ncbi:MAG: helix-turn-helix transcriptional regulator, partial [Acidobacteriota bacterium]|nr:helix-turn-helix transcriptional regulator [Acidobacteriota bacterium]
MSAGETLVTARKRANLSQSELAARAGVGRGLLSRYETGSSSPEPAVLARLLDAARNEINGHRLQDLLELADALPHRWPGDTPEFPAHLWK